MLVILYYWFHIILRACARCRRPPCRDRKVWSCRWFWWSLGILGDSLGRSQAVLSAPGWSWGGLFLACAHVCAFDLSVGVRTYMHSLASWGLMGHLGTDLGSPWSILGSVLGTKNIASKTLFGNYVKNVKTQKNPKNKRRPEASFLQRSAGKTNLPIRPFIS